MLTTGPWINARREVDVVGTNAQTISIANTVLARSATAVRKDRMRIFTYIGYVLAKQFRCQCYRWLVLRVTGDQPRQSSPRDKEAGSHDIANIYLL